MKLRRSQASEPRFEMAPLIDVVFLLLTFFIFAIVLMVRADTLEIDLPQLGSASPTEAPELITLLVPEDGNISLDGEPVEIGSLADTVKAKQAERPNARLVLAIDQERRSGDFLKVMDTLAGAGITQFSFIGRTGPEPGSSPESASEPTPQPSNPQNQAPQGP